MTLSFNWGVLLLALPLLYLVDANHTSCPNGWVRMNDRCVKGFQERQTWSDARQKCKHMGGDLVEIRNDFENNLVRNLVPAPETLWIGISDSNKDQKFEYLDGSVIGWAKWHSAEPNNHGGNERCVQMYGGKTWNDQQCHAPNCYACQVQATDRDQHDFECDDDNWTKVNGKCFLPHKEHISWQDARKFCKSVGGDLVEIENEFENNAVRNLIPGNEHIWIGASDFNVDKKFTYGSGKVISWAKWNINEPNNLGGKEFCVEMYGDKKWNDRDCGVTRASVCQKNAEDVKFAGLKCDDDFWTRVNGKCILPMRETKSWQHAQQFCKNVGGSLVEIQNEYENNAVRNLLPGHGNIWIGILDLKKDRQFVYGNGIAISWANWGEIEPNNLGGKEFCVEMYENKKWNDRDCHVVRQFACQKNAEDASYSNLQCEDDAWTKVNGKCFLPNTDCKSWQDAQKYCKTVGGDLVEVENEFENIVVRNMLVGKGNIWIGLSDFNKDGKFVFGSGKMISWANWHAGEPNNHGGNEQCVEIWHNKWNDRACHVHRAFVCQKVANGPKKPDYECQGEGWKLVDEKCIVGFDEAKSWYGARETCSNVGGDLVEIKNNLENVAVRNAIPGDKNIWIGICDSNYDGKFEYLDFSVIGFADWSGHEPNNLGGNEACVEMYKTRKWNDRDCAVQRPFVCEKAARKIRRPVRKCDDGWTRVNRKCVRAFNTPKTWFEANKDCKVKGGDLASVRNIHENTVVRSLITGKISIWVGLVDSNKDGKFEYTDKSIVGWTYWATAEPNNAGGNEHCVEQFPDGRWNDQGCSDKRYYVCEKTAIDLDFPGFTTVKDCEDESWTKLNEKCVKAVKVPKTWHNAQKDCVFMGGDLVEVVSDFENHVVRNVAAGLSNIWIGIKDYGHNRQFKLLNNLHIKWSAWSAPIEPNNYGGNEFCVEMYPTNRWNDRDCNAKRPFVCQKEQVEYFIPIWA